MWQRPYRWRACVRVRVRACFPCRRPWRFSEGWSWKQRRWTAACSRGKPPAPWCRAGPINTQDTALGYPVTWRLAARSPPPQLTPPLQGPKYQILSIYDSDSIVIYQSFWFPRHPRFSLCPRNSRQTNKETNKRDEWWLPLPHTLQNPPILLHHWARHRWETHTHTRADVSEKMLPPCSVMMTSRVWVRDCSKHDAS